MPFDLSPAKNGTKDPLQSGSNMSIHEDTDICTEEPPTPCRPQFQVQDQSGKRVSLSIVAHSLHSLASLRSHSSSPVRHSIVSQEDDTMSQSAPDNTIQSCDPSLTEEDRMSESFKENLGDQMVDIKTKPSLERPEQCVEELVYSYREHQGTLDQELHGKTNLQVGETSRDDERKLSNSIYEHFDPSDFIFSVDKMSEQIHPRVEALDYDHSNDSLTEYSPIKSLMSYGKEFQVKSFSGSDHQIIDTKKSDDQTYQISNIKIRVNKEVDMVEEGDSFLVNDEVNDESHEVKRGDERDSCMEAESLSGNGQMLRDLETVDVRESGEEKLEKREMLKSNQNSRHSLVNCDPWEETRNCEKTKYSVRPITRDLTLQCGRTKNISNAKVEKPSIVKHFRDKKEAWNQYHDSLHGRLVSFIEFFFCFDFIRIFWLVV